MIQLFIANKNYSSWSLRPWLLMRELGIPFTEHLEHFRKGSSWEAFRGFSPTGKVPCLIEDGQVIWDSLGITLHLAERYPQIWPSDPAARSWARCAAAEMHSGFTALRQYCTMNCGIRVALSNMSEALQKDIARIDELWQEGLSRFGGPYLAGAQFSAADAFFAPVVFRIQTYGLTMSAAATAYCQHMLALPGMKQWYQDALQENLREPEHEQEAMQAGTWLHDYRHQPV
ncbi:glutathione S-transferase family protein [Undibacterium oligocarboniphilum]|uniref:Glutathione S-transferase family protein n=1 Tax=Undibacterium oligocarboniphilum TaxID=666702 RepID=A0A850QRB7_9BURK|nr:glutathione S-transferase family protein [Undibacterium oligocarboniphilum]MBC3871798.1 glutathione S-transferase family protein [Undibacterium oligocarboniphilum]NVO79350.1 glutathione S-transferase family protein [Undibacterium oligocarboniphilum]